MREQGIVWLTGQCLVGYNINRYGQKTEHENQEEDHEQFRINENS